MSKSFEPKCITTEKWDPLANDYSQPRPNKLGGKNIYINNTQIRSNLVLQTPLMRTWGISVYVDEKGEQQGGYSLSLVFDREGYETPEAVDFKKKVQQFEDEVVKKAYDNRLAWFGDDDISLDTIRRGFYPMLKYPPMKDEKGNKLKKRDLTKSPTLKIRVNNYDNKWQCRVYDSNLQPLYVPENVTSSPIDFVPRNSMIITKIKCDGIWTGSANISWGIKWNLQVCVVQPFEKVETRSDPFGVSDMDTSKFSGLAPNSASTSTVASKAGTYAVLQDDDEEEGEEEVKKVSTHVDDSDEELPAPVVEIVKVEESFAPKKKVIKKVVK